MQECPSFNSYSSNRLADVAAKVGKEECASDDRRVDEDNFEFTFVSTDEVLRETQIGPISKKSSSTGSASKRRRFRDLLRRSNSEGKDSFVFLTPSKREEKADVTDKSDHSKETRNSVDAS